MARDRVPPPVNRYDAANWLVDRHPWLKDLAERVVGPLDSPEVMWLELLHDAISDEAAHSVDGRAYAVMSSGERDVLRLLATLAYDRVPWCVGDVGSFDERAAAILADWLAVVRAQIPAHMYPADPESGDGDG